MTATQKIEFQRLLLHWYRENRRQLPWHLGEGLGESHAYGVWVSELMLQQTQVATVIPFWHRWMTRFPNVVTLAQADEADVLSQWQGLGYYRRARALHSGAKMIVEKGWPQSSQEWKKLPGIGAYTAGAIASISLREVVELVDGNVERVYSRLVGDRAINPILNRNAWKWAKEHLSTSHPGDWNQALMELGATICKPRDPACITCPVQQFCVAFAANTILELPTPTPRKPVVELDHIVFVPVSQGKFGIHQIPPGQWWEGMWQFPRCPAESTELLLSSLGPGVVDPLIEFKHTVTHHRIKISAYMFACKQQAANLRWVSESELGNHALPAPQRRIGDAVIRRMAERNLFDSPA